MVSQEMKLELPPSQELQIQKPKNAAMVMEPHQMSLEQVPQP
jgi:hypothetical protein